MAARDVSRKNSEIRRTLRFRSYLHQMYLKVRGKTGLILLRYKEYFDRYSCFKKNSKIRRTLRFRSYLHQMYLRVRR